MSHLTILLLIILFIAIFAIVFMKIKENFNSLLTDNIAQDIIQQQQMKCAPIYNALNTKDEDYALSREFRISSSETQGKETCKIRKDDPIFIPSHKNCDMNNPQLYDPRLFSNVIESIYSGQEIDPEHSTIIPSDVCYINFKPNAQKNNVVSYMNYLNAQDPNIKMLSNAILSETNLYNTCSTNLDNTQNLYSEANSELVQANAKIGGYQSMLNSLNQQIGSLSNALVDANFNNLQLRNQLTTDSQELAQCSSTRQTLDAMTLSNQKLQAQLNQETIQYANCQNLAGTISTLQDNLNMASQSNRALQTQLNNANNANNTSGSELVRDNSLIGALTLSNQALQAQINTLKNQICTGGYSCVNTNTWNSLNSTNTSLVNEVNSLTSQLKTATAASLKFCNVPGGSWIQSCSNLVTYDVNTAQLTGRCKDGRGGWVNIPFPSPGCSSAWNNYGKLQCG